MPEYNFGGLVVTQPTPSIYSTMMAHISGVGEPIFPHHPIQCPDSSTWEWNGDDDFSCKHKAVPVTDEKLQAAVTFSLAAMIIEEARKL